MNSVKTKNISIGLLLLVLTACGGDFGTSGSQSSGSRIRSTSSNSSSRQDPAVCKPGEDCYITNRSSSSSPGGNTDGGSGIPNMNGFGSLSTTSSSSSSLSNSSSSASNTSNGNSNTASESPSTFDSKGDTNSSKTLLTAEEEAALDRALPTFNPFINHLGSCIAIAARDGSIAPSWQESLIYWRDSLVKYEEWAIFLRDNRRYTPAQWAKISLFYQQSYYSRYWCNELLKYPVR